MITGRPAHGFHALAAIPQAGTPPPVVKGRPTTTPRSAIHPSAGLGSPGMKSRTSGRARVLWWRMRHEHDAPTIGLIHCQTKDRIFAEYALRDVHKLIGLAEYEFSRALP